MHCLSIGRCRIFIVCLKGAVDYALDSRKKMYKWYYFVSTFSLWTFGISELSCCLCLLEVERTSFIFSLAEQSSAHSRLGLIVLRFRYTDLCSLPTKIPWWTTKWPKFLDEMSGNRPDIHCISRNLVTKRKETENHPGIFYVQAIFFKENSSINKSRILENMTIADFWLAWEYVWISNSGMETVV